MSDFEREIERDLHRALDPALTDLIPTWRVPPAGSFTKRLLSGAGAALGFKVLTGIAVAAAAATIAGAATETAITGSVSPSVWGQQVRLQVDACKDRLAMGHRGIGDCVSDFTTKHEDTVSDTPQAQEAAQPKSAGEKKPDRPAQAPGKDSGHDDRARLRPGVPSPHDTEHRSSDRTGSQSHAIPPRP